MKCPKCKRTMDFFLGGKSGTFVPISTRYICTNCKIQFRSFSGESNGDYQQYTLEHITINDNTRKSK